MSKEKSQKELTQIALEFLQGQRVAVISTVGKDGAPYAATVFYYLKDDNTFDFYFFTQDLTKKFANLEKDNRIAVTVFSEKDPQIIQAQGSAWLVEDGEESRDAISKLTDVAVGSSKWYDPPIAKIKAGELQVVRVEISWLRYADFRQTSSSPSPFHQIIP